jgi:hypothetical protein
MPNPRLPFMPLPHAEPTLWQRLLHRRPRENAFVEVNNLLAAAPSVRAIDATDVQRICRLHRVELRGPIAGRFERLYRDYLLYCLEDRHLSDDELADLQHLRVVLRIGSEAALAIHEYAARHVYSRSVGDVLADGIIDEDERAFLSALQRTLSIGPRTADRIEQTTRRVRR